MFYKQTISYTVIHIQCMSQFIYLFIWLSSDFDEFYQASLLFVPTVSKDLMIY